MDERINFKNTAIRYKVEGSGTPIVLLHGYLESLGIWNHWYWYHHLLKNLQVMRCNFLTGY
jgi:pimeloyl-ACP methyl ester carboxylesterase